MLRESIQTSGTEFDLHTAMGSAKGSGGIRSGQNLADFAEAITLQDAERVAALRETLVRELGVAGMLDAAAVASAFHGFVRVADSTGAPPAGASGGQVTMEFREELGINDFYGAAHH